MICNLPRGLPTNPASVDELEELRNRFYLTGSRFFGGGDDDSDWDFFATYTTDLLETLVDRGFSIVFGEYGDRHCNIVISKGKTHVQLVDDAELKCQIQREIYLDFNLRIIYRRLDKAERTLLWNYLYSKSA